MGKTELTDGGILCWFCPICETMTLLEKAERGECASKPRRNDCPLDTLNRARRALTTPWWRAPQMPEIDQIIPGGVRPTDHWHRRTNDRTCSRCREEIEDGEVPLMLWSNDGHDMLIYCEICLGVENV